jgi:hypothetical protein
MESFHFTCTFESNKKKQKCSVLYVKSILFSQSEKESYSPSQLGRELAIFARTGVHRTDSAGSRLKALVGPQSAYIPYSHAIQARYPSGWPTPAPPGASAAGSSPLRRILSSVTNLRFDWLRLQCCQSQGLVFGRIELSVVGLSLIVP